MIYQCYKHKGDFMRPDEIGKSAEPKSRIMAIYEQLQTLGNEVVELQIVVNENRTKYFASEGVCTEKEKSQGGAVNDIEWMIGDIKRMVLDIREYVETL